MKNHFACFSAASSIQFAKLSSFWVFLVSAIFFGSVGYAQRLERDPVAKPEVFERKLGIFPEFFNYQEPMYSRSRKTELGDQLILDTALRYQHSENTFGRFRFTTDPQENRFDNKTSRFELLFGHQYEKLYFQVDFDIRTDDRSPGGDTSGQSLGLDVFSELNLMSYRLNENIKILFYPFNFDGEVGRQFNSWDVTRMYYITGAPNTVDPRSPLENEKIAAKTIPGLELQWYPTGDDNFRFFGALGAATYLYPGNADFRWAESFTRAERWERRENIGYKFGTYYRNPSLRIELDYVGHTRSAETGSLLAAAGNLYIIQSSNRFIQEVEVGYSKAGSQPFELDRESDWFLNPGGNFAPIYADYLGERPQNWLGRADMAISTRFGFEYSPKFVPYLTAKYQGANFVFRERKSAHRLRTNDRSDSHGGLMRLGVGSVFYKGAVTINPEFEWLRARNPVFTNAADVRQDAILTGYTREDFLVFLTLTYTPAGSNLFRP